MPPKKRTTRTDDAVDVIDVDGGACAAPAAKAASPGAKKNFLAEMAAAKAQKGTMSEGTQAAAASGALDLRKEMREEGWSRELASLFAKPYFAKIESTLATEINSKKKQVFPPLPMVFSAFNECPLESLKVVLIGQDPYHDNNQAHGMAFSVMPGIKTPPSLVNMYTELEQDIPGFKRPPHGYLLPWARQGVLMINASLTVEAHKANSHKDIGWQLFTDDVIQYINTVKKDVVFLLWGGFAQKKGKMIDRKRHRVIECAHPSPLSVTKWRGCKTFSKCNAALVELGKTPIEWTLPADAALVDPHSN